MNDIAQRLGDVRARIAASAAAAGRQAAAVTLIAVSKTRPAEAIREAYAAGQRDFGENYAQELAQKRESLADLTDLRWHFIGALQSNKAKLVVPGTVLVHAIDRASTAQALGRRARAHGEIAGVLVEVNVGDEASKSGLPFDEVEPFVVGCEGVEGVRVRGLMCVPPAAERPEASRPFFRRLRELRDRLQEGRPGFDLLSMGMTHDFEVAIAEGATHVRIGTAIFGARPTR